MWIGFYKKIALTLAAATLLFGSFSRGIEAQTLPLVVIEVFEREDCVHCQEEKAFLEKLKERRNDIEVRYLNLDDSANYQEWVKVAERNNLPKVTPLTRIGGILISGFDKAETSGVQIERIIDEIKGRGNISEEGVYIYDAGCEDEDAYACLPEGIIPETVSTPFFGNIELERFSLPALSAALGFVDGFNPCAMWVLLTFIVILAQVGSRRAMWRFVGLFVVAEAVMYYLILNVWFSAWDFVGLDRIVTPIIGTLAIIGGFFFIREWWKKEIVCETADMEKQRKLTFRLKQIASRPFNIFTALAIIGIAFSVNVIEFACSIGVPQAFTKILELNNLGFFQSQWYMVIYILFYMLDDLVVFALALYGINKIATGIKYAKLSNLIGGVLMILLGLILVFKPNWLFFF